jgi:glycosyltransferase involved in cell wall biosynthesis
MKVLLVGNYPADGQRSMERFGAMLLRALKEEGIEAEMVRPAVVLGKFGKPMRGIQKWLGYADKFLLFRPALLRAVEARPGWRVHILDQGNGIWAGWLRANSTGPIVTCHDLLAIRAARGEFPARRTRWTGRIFQSLILRGLRRAGTLACISSATQSDARRLIRDGALIPNGVEDFWKPAEPDHSRGDYLLHVGGDQWYKNRPGVVRLFIDLRMQTTHTPRLVMVGPAFSFSALKAAGLEAEVTVLESVNDEALRVLYSSARALLFPSLEEGAGWPILEAQACGCPVITRRKHPMLETGGDAAIYADDGEWVAAISEVLEMDPARRAAVVAAGIANARRYSAKRMAREYIELYRSQN